MWRSLTRVADEQGGPETGSAPIHLPFPGDRTWGREPGHRWELEPWGQPAGVEAATGEGGGGRAEASVTRPVTRLREAGPRR